MVPEVTLVAENLKIIQRNIQQFSVSPEKVRILGVTKFQPLERIREALDCGISLFGVNYVQEGQKLRQELQSQNIEWHFIGHIQSRKAKLLLDYECIQSLDRLDIAEDLNQRLEAVGKKLKVLVEVNIGNEPQKSGVKPEALEEFVLNMQSFSSLIVEGLMSMPPPLPGEARRPFFKQMKNIYDKLSAVYPFNTLSMGTSEDYQIALEEGANLIRLGTCLFGKRW